MTAANNTKHGDNIIEETQDTFGSIKHVASFQFQKFIDSLGELLRLTPITFVVAAYGGIKQTGTPAMADIDSTFQTIAFNAITLTNPKGVTQDFANDALIFGFEGIWSVKFQIALEFVDINAGREMQFRIFNATTATAGSLLDFFVGRNQGGLNAIFSIDTEVPLAVVGDLFEVQVGSAADTFTVVSNIGSRFETNHVSEFVGSLI